MDIENAPIILLTSFIAIFLIISDPKLPKKGYIRSLNKYYLSRPENVNLSLPHIISKNPKTIQYELLDIIHDMNVKQG